MSYSIQTREPVPAWPEPFADALSEHDPGTFHVRNAAIQAAADAMFFADVLDDEAEPDWPDWPPISMEPERAEAVLAHLDGDEPLEPPLSESEQEAWRRFVEDREHARAKRSVDPDRVPSYKFQSHDGWIVTAEEARAIADAIGALLDNSDELELYVDVHDIEDSEDHAAFLERWGMFNATAAEYDGYTLS